jgi:hypothetical protein
VVWLVRFLGEKEIDRNASQASNAEKSLLGN